MPKPVKVGVYDLGSESVEIMARSGIGAEFTTRSDEQMMPLVTLGFDNTWEGIVANITHELAELTAVRMNCRYHDSVDYARDNGARLFVYTHTQHSEVCARVGYFLAACYDDLSKAWKKWKKENRQ